MSAERCAEAVDWGDERGLSVDAGLGEDVGQMRVAVLIEMPIDDAAATRVSPSSSRSTICASALVSP
jgi:hypothetical protein